MKITADALRMRCRRLCEQKPSGKLQVDPEISKQYKAGGESREALEMALLESLSIHGTDRSNYKRIKAWIRTSWLVIYGHIYHLDIYIYIYVWPYLHV